MPHRRHAALREGAAVMAAGARLEAMRRRVRLSRAAVWTVIAAGPVALAVAITSTPTATEAAPQDRSSVVQPVAAVAADPAGYAQVFMNAWLRSSADDTTTAQARLAQSMAPDVDLPDPLPDAQAEPASVTAVRSAHADGGTWQVTVAAQFADGTLRYFTVPVTTNTTGTSCTVTGAPAIVAGPDRTAPAESPYTVTVPNGELNRAVTEFLAAYLTGAGEVDRYLAPGIHLTAVSPPRSPPSRCGKSWPPKKLREANRFRATAPGCTSRRLPRRTTAPDGGRWPTSSPSLPAPAAGKSPYSAPSLVEAEVVGREHDGHGDARGQARRCRRSLDQHVPPLG